MFNKLRNLIRLANHKGVNALFLYLLIKLKIINLNFNNYYGKTNTPHFFKMKKKIFDKILNISKSRVISGFYKSTYLFKEKIYEDYFSSQLVGCYELQVQKKIIALQAKYRLKNIVNFGSGEGFHTLGLVKNKFFLNGFCFEINPETRRILGINIIKNGLENKISVYNEASIFKINSLLSEKELKKTLFLIDIEGAEFTLINKKTINFIRHSYLIIENHPFNCSKKILKRFWRIINYYFNYELLYSSSRNPLEIKKLNSLSEDEKWIAVSENRRLMNWIICVPKNNV